MITVQWLPQEETRPRGSGRSHPSAPLVESMSDLQVFDFAATGQRVRTIVEDGEPRFVAADV